MEREHQEAIEKLQQQHAKELSKVETEVRAANPITEDEAAWTQEREQLKQ